MLSSIIFLKYIINPRKKTEEINKNHIDKKFCLVTKMVINIIKNNKTDINKSNSLIVKMAEIPLKYEILNLFFNNMGIVSSPKRKGNILLTML